MRNFILTLMIVASTIPERTDGEVAQCIVPSMSENEAPSRDVVAGHYATVSESEWNLEILLNPDGTAEVLSEAWEAGHHDKRTSEHQRGSWKLSGSHVELRYNGLCETLRFEPTLSFAEFGGDGAAPGLRGRYASASVNLFVGQSLWQVVHLRRISEIE